MMSPTAIFLIGVLATSLLALFLYVSVHEVRKGEHASGSAAAATDRWPQDEPPGPHSAGPMRILVATDGSACSARAIDSVVRRPWPDKSLIEVVTVVHTDVPAVPDVFLAGAAAHVTALEEDRQRAPERVRLAEQRLAGLRGVSRSSTILEGNPPDVIVAEARRWGADLVVIGSHGHGSVGRLVLGSVSQQVAQSATCSVEIVRCRPEEPAGT